MARNINNMTIDERIASAKKLLFTEFDTFMNEYQINLENKYGAGTFAKEMETTDPEEIFAAFLKWTRD